MLFYDVDTLLGNCAAQQFLKEAALLVGIKAFSTKGEHLKYLLTVHCKINSLNCVGGREPNASTIFVAFVALCHYNMYLLLVHVGLKRNIKC